MLISINLLFFFAHLFYFSVDKQIEVSSIDITVFFKHKFLIEFNSKFIMQNNYFVN